MSLHKYPTFHFSLVLILLLSVAGCLNLLMETGKKAMEDRTTENQVTDTKIAAGILSRFTDRDTGLLLDVNVDVWEQRVLLTGTLDDPQEKQAVLDLAKTDSRIKTLYDDIQIVTKAEKEARRKQAEDGKQDNKSSLGQTVDDIWINTKVEAQLIAQKGVTSVNYRWRSVRNIVSVIGRAADSTERNMVLDIIQQTEGVTKVQSYIDIKPRAS